MLSSWLSLSTCQSLPGLGQFVISFELLGFTLSGLLLAKIRFLVVMLVWEWSVLVVLPFSASSVATPEFLDFYWLGRAMNVTLPTSEGGVVNLFVVYGYQGAEEDAEKLLLTDRLLEAVLAEAQVVCGGQPLLIAGDF